MYFFTFIGSVELGDKLFRNGINVGYPFRTYTRFITILFLIPQPLLQNIGNHWKKGEHWFELVS